MSGARLVPFLQQRLVKELSWIKASCRNPQLSSASIMHLHSSPTAESAS